MMGKMWRTAKDKDWNVTWKIYKRRRE